MKKTALVLLLSGLLITGLSGCGRTVQEKTEIEDLTKTGEINYQTADAAIPANSKKLESQLLTNHYYILHNGAYYPLATGANNYDSDKPTTRVDKTRQIYFTTENEIQIPTLFEGDELIYYSTDTLLDYVTWERYYDMGYTVGIHNISFLTNKRPYLNIESSKTPYILPESELYEIYNLNVDNVLLDKIGGVQLTEDMITDGLINSLEKSENYDLEIYAGTYYKHYLTTANMHAFKAYELYASVEYTTLQDCFYRVEIPDYFVNGYYEVNGLGFFRLVKGTGYTENTEFNEQVLFPQIDTTAYDYDPDAYVAPYLYSTFAELNEFKTNVEGAVGYLDNTSTVEKEEKTVDITKAVKKEIDIYFPADKECEITITSSTGESTGDIYVKIENMVTRLPWDRATGEYSAVISAKKTAQRGLLTVTGLFTSYDITLKNCEQYTDQLEDIPSAETTEEIESTAEEVQGEN